MTDQTLIYNFINALQERSYQQSGGLDYAMGFMFSVLQELNLDRYESNILRKNTDLLHELIDKHNKEMEKKIKEVKEVKEDSWIPACGGTEVPFKSRSGKRLQYVWQPSTGHHAYLDVDSDIILSDEEAEAALALH
jgi:hypothetical protein